MYSKIMLTSAVSGTVNYAGAHSPGTLHDVAQGCRNLDGTKEPDQDLACFTFLFGAALIINPVGGLNSCEIFVDAACGQK